ncbi:MAG: sigma factor G inhibitor Gin [Limnochordia bacterium]|jgi:hypothetical protein
MVCDLCGQPYTGDGLEIKRAHICGNCERAIVSAEVSDPDYLVWIERIKQIWGLFLSVQTPLSGEPIL